MREKGGNKRNIIERREKSSLKEDALEQANKPSSVS